MAEPLIAVVLLVVGIALAAGGFLFFETGLYVLGFLLGASAGLAALNSGELPQEWAIAVLVLAPILGVGLARAFQFLLVAIPGALTGATVGIVLSDASLANPESVVDPMVVIGGVLGIVVAWFLKTAIIVLVTSSWGASLVALAVGPGVGSVTTDTKAAILGLLSTTYVVVLLGGVGVQVWLWYYLRKSLDDDQDPKEFLIRRLGKSYESVRN